MGKTEQNEKIEKKLREAVCRAGNEKLAQMQEGLTESAFFSPEEKERMFRKILARTREKHGSTTEISVSCEPVRVSAPVSKGRYCLQMLPHILSSTAVLVFILGVCYMWLIRPNSKPDTVGRYDLYDENTAYRGDELYAYGNSLYSSFLYIERYPMPMNGTEKREDILPQCVCSDPNCLHNSEMCPAYSGVSKFDIVLADREASEKRGVPVLFLASSVSIERYDTAENKRETVFVFDEEAEDCIELWLYRDYLYAILKFSDGYEIVRCDKDTGENGIGMKLNARNRYDIRILGFWGEQILLRDTDFLLCRMDLDMREISRFGDIAVSGGLIADEYLYYCKDITERKYGDYSYQTADLYRRKLGDGADVFSGAEEKLDETVFCDGDPLMYWGENKLLYTKADPVKLGECEHVVWNGETERYGCFLDGTQKLYAYDPEAGKSSVFCEFPGTNLVRFVNANDRYMVLTQEIPYQKGENTWENRRETRYYDLITGAQTKNVWEYDTITRVLTEISNECGMMRREAGQS